MEISSKVYDILKWLATVILPALSVFYVALANVWGWPCAKEVAATIAAICAFIGTIIGISSANYWAEQKVEEEVAGAKKKAK